MPSTNTAANPLVLRILGAYRLQSDNRAAVVAAALAAIEAASTVFLP